MSYHIPALLNECIEGLNIKPTGTYIDTTFGGGGHSGEILKQLTSGILIAFDQDADIPSELLQNQKLIFVRHNFRYLSRFLDYHQIETFDGLLADLGISSHQIDTPHRGFSFRYDGPLDMRMNQNASLTASQIINFYDKPGLYSIFKEYGELNNAGKLADVIFKKRLQGPINTVSELVETIKFLAPRESENKYMAQVFQALRIEVNGELDNLKEMLIQAEQRLKPGGRLVVITYHSLEDRLVKNFFKTGNFNGEVIKDFYGNVIAPLRPVNKNVILPQENEIAYNPRARSAKLRIAEKNKTS